MSEVLVQANGVARVFGSGSAAVTAVKEASFDIMAGTQTGLVGPSGSGKSTILHLIAGLDRPTAGSMDWPALGPRDQLRPGPVAFGFQGPSLLPPLSVEENVALPLMLAGESEEEALAAARTMIERLGLAPVASKLPEELSGGQEQRAGLARALTGTPRLVLADEPTGQQDQVTGSMVVDVMLSCVELTGAALVIATHDLTVAKRLSARWTMEDGRLDTGVVLRSA